MVLIDVKAIEMAKSLDGEQIMTVLKTQLWLGFLKTWLCFNLVPGLHNHKKNQFP